MSSENSQEDLCNRLNMGSDLLGIFKRMGE